MHPVQSEIVAGRVSTEIPLDAANSAPEWQLTQPVRFCADWQGKNSDPALETEVRVLWSAASLYLRFSYRELFVFEDSESNGRRDHLWDRDVAEAFLQPPDQIALSDPGGASVPARAEVGVDGRPYAFYKEFEVAPNGMWIDLDVSPSGLADLESGLTRSVHVDAERKIWTAELAIPMRSLTTHFDPNAAWRANFYRVEDNTEPRQYLAWQPTHTPQPNFHVPKAFGTLRFDSGAVG
jgi:alpha-galactosidase